MLASLPAVAATETRSGGTIVVGEGRNVDEDLQAFGGSVIVRGTVNGDVTAAGGDLQRAESGTVRGDVEASGGSVEIAGTVTGDVNICGGSARITDTARIDGSLQAGAGSIYLDGTVGNNATLGADRITLGSNAQITSDLRTTGNSPGPAIGFGGPVFNLYGGLVTLLLGAVLLVAFPDFSHEVADRVTADPVRLAVSVCWSRSVSSSA